MSDFFINWWKCILVIAVAITVLCLTVLELTIFDSMIMGLFAIIICINLDDRKKEEEDKHLTQNREICINAFDKINLFVYQLASTYSFGADLDAPQNISSLYGGYIFLPKYTGFEMRIHFLTVGRTPIPANKWKQKEAIFQTDFDWGVQNANLTGTINVKHFFYSDNAAWLDIEVIP